jgi:hypothetical protein
MELTELLVRAGAYAQPRRLTLGERLGAGVQGIVFSAENQVEGGQSAVKVHRRGADYSRERNAYLRLTECGITSIGPCNVPELIAFDDGLWVVEMTIVTRPFVLDFGGAYLDHAPDFSDEVLADWRAEKREQFGDRWADVLAILRFLEGYGIVLIDVNPGNISFGA